MKNPAARSGRCTPARSARGSPYLAARENKTLVLIRRPAEWGWPRSAFLDAVAARIGYRLLSPAAENPIEPKAALMACDYHAFCRWLEQAGGLHFEPDLKTVCPNAAAAARAAVAGGRKVHLLVDGEQARAGLAMAELPASDSIGPVLPHPFDGDVIALIAPGRAGDHALAPQLARAGKVAIFVAADQIADRDTLVTHLRIASLYHPGPAIAVRRLGNHLN